MASVSDWLLVRPHVRDLRRHWQRGHAQLADAPRVRVHTAGDARVVLEREPAHARGILTGAAKTVTATHEYAADSESWRQSAVNSRWLDLDAVAHVTIMASGQRLSRRRHTWSADCPGEQTIEIRFRQPTSVSRFRIVSSETEQARTEEMTLWASMQRGERHREVLRKQFTFSPHGATERVEDYALDLDDVSAIQLRIVPSIDGRPCVARVSEVAVASV